VRPIRAFLLGALFAGPIGAIGACSASSVNDVFDPEDSGRDATTDTTRSEASTSPAEDADVEPDDATSDAKSDANVIKDAGNETTTTDASDASDASDAAPDCANIPVVQSNPGPFCFGVGDASTDGSASGANCPSAQGNICCSGDPIDGGAFVPSSCIAPGNASVGYATGMCSYPNGGTGTEWHCTQASHCPNGGERCCAIKSAVGQPMPGQNNDYPGCPVYFQSGRFVGGTRCQATCGAGELQLCSSNAECAAGTCVPITISGRFTGYCRL
jgi:hypothetical protein